MCACSLKGTSRPSVNWKCDDAMLRDVFHDLSADWIRYFLMQNEPMDFVRYFSSADVMKEATPYLFQGTSPGPLCSAISLQALPVPMMEFGDFRIGLKVMRIEGTGDYETLVHSPLACRRFVWNKRKNTMFSIGWTNSGVEVSWHRIEQQGLAVVHLDFDATNFTEALPTDTTVLSFDVLAEAIRKVSVCIATSCSSYVIIPRGWNTPFGIGEFIANNIIADPTVPNVPGRIQANVNLPSFAFDNLKRLAISYNMQMVPAQPRSLPFRNHPVKTSKYAQQFSTLQRNLPSTTTTGMHFGALLDAVILGDEQVVNPTGKYPVVSLGNKAIIKSATHHSCRVTPTANKNPSSSVSTQEMKALRKKLQNRESAARSNLKKKLYFQNLKASIANENRRVVELEGRLSFLRKENAEIRQLIAGSSLCAR